MSCGCGCGKPTNGMMMSGSFGVPLTGMGALGDDTTDYGFTDTTNIVTPVDYGLFTAPITTPITPSYTPAASPSPTTNLLDSLAASWSAAAQQILKSNAGALPTYQTINPLTGASTTVYGNASNIPTSLTTAVSSLTTGSGGLLLLGGAALLIVMMMSKGR